MTTFTLILSPLLALQAAGQAPVAIKNDAPETWTLEYPRVIQPYIDDYRRCLTGRMRRITGEATMESQHRADLPACEKEFEEAQANSNRVIGGRGEYAEYTPADIREVFEHIGRIHIARGADLDGQFSFIVRSMQAHDAEYTQERAKGLVLELRDASVVKARTDATAAAAEAAQEAREQRIETNRQQNSEGGNGAPN